MGNPVDRTGPSPRRAALAVKKVAVFAASRANIAGSFKTIGGAKMPKMPGFGDPASMVKGFGKGGMPVYVTNMGPGGLRGGPGGPATGPGVTTTTGGKTPNGILGQPDRLAQGHV